MRRRIALVAGAAVPHERRAQDAGAPRDARRLLEHHGRARRPVRPARRPRPSSSTSSRRSPQYVEVRPGLLDRRGRPRHARVRPPQPLRVRVVGDLPRPGLVPARLPHPRPAGRARTTSRCSTADRIATRDTVTLAWPEMGLGPTIRVAARRRLRARPRARLHARQGLRSWARSSGARARRSSSAAARTTSTTTCTCSASATIAGRTWTSNPEQHRSRAPAARARRREQRRRRAASSSRGTGATAPFNAHKGTYVALGVEQVELRTRSHGTARSTPNAQFEGHIPAPDADARRLHPDHAEASSLRRRAAPRRDRQHRRRARRPSRRPDATPQTYCTYPDRLFFMGGFDSMRGWLQDTFIPQDYADQIAHGTLACTEPEQLPGRRCAAATS